MARSAKSNFERLVTRTDRPIAFVIANHLWIEHILIECLRVSLPRPAALLDPRSPPFPLLVDLCEAHGILEPDFAVVLRKLNALRNKFAHNLAFKPTMPEVEAVQRALREMKDAFFSSFVPPSENTLLKCLAAISGHLELRAQKLGVRGMGSGADLLGPRSRHFRGRRGRQNGRDNLR